MAGVSEILVGGGVAAVLAAAIGGGLKAYGVELPLVASPRRQIFLLIMGTILIALGYFAPNRGAETKEVVRHPKPEVSGLRAIDFRSSDSTEGLNPEASAGYLLVTTSLAVRNTIEPARTLTWKSTSATLTVDGATIPYKDYYFTTLQDSGDPWLGKDAVAARPLSVKAGDVVQQEIMFLPANTGAGRYKWGNFLKAITRTGGDQNPVFDVTVHLSVGSEEVAAKTLRCTSKVDELMDRIRPRLGRWITAECR